MKISERDIITRIRGLSPSAGQNLVTGIGDDCAVVGRENGVVELISTDTLVENVHFESSWHPPELLGRKSAAVNLSDVAAMGGVPRYGLLSLALSDQITDAWLDGFISGFLEMLTRYNVELIGGDTVRSSGPAMFSVTVIGQSDETKVLRRDGAKVGDALLVSGQLGDAAAGLELCRAGMKDDVADRWPVLLKAHLDPDPEIDLGIFLADTGRVNAMMDMSDGLVTDLAHICQESGCGAEIETSLLPISVELQEAAEQLHLQPEKLALSGGEDYRLLFTVANEEADELIRVVNKEIGRNIYKVGRIIQAGGVFLLDGQSRVEVGYQGFDHHH